MEYNQFGRVSSLKITTGLRDNKTYLSDVAFTAPYKIMLPFEKKSGGLRVMLMAASAGIMEGDRQEFKFRVNSGTELEFVSQSYDKIHQMKEGCAKRETFALVCSGGTFFYNPQPTIPFKDSAFESRMDIRLEDETSKLFLSEIFSCGRYARGERFEYRFYGNLVEIRRADRLIYRDNTRFEPSRADIAGMGMYEGHTHLLNIFITRPENPDEFADEVRNCFSQHEECECGITELSDGDYAVRALGMRAQKLEELSNSVKELYARQC